MTSIGKNGKRILKDPILRAREKKTNGYLAEWTSLTFADHNEGERGGTDGG